MKKNQKNPNKKIIALFIIFILSIGILFPLTIAAPSNGIDKGPSYLPTVPLKKTTFVGYDENNYLDDYAYLAAVPTSVFKAEEKLYSHPLLFYEDEFQYTDDKARSLNARQGIDYFMEDWMMYCDGTQDQINLINVDKNDIPPSWKTEKTTTIQSNNMYEIAKQIALNDFSYTDEAVIAVADEAYEDITYDFNAELSGSIPGLNVIEETFYTPQANKLNPRFHEFTVPEGYMFIKARTWWASITTGIGKESDLPISMLITIPTADPDTQFYCNFGGEEWLQVAYTQAWNLNEGMDEERTQMYAYTNGKWMLRVTDIPTHDVYGSIRNILSNMFRGVTYQTDITIFPGEKLQIPENPPFGCRNATFTLTWDNANVDLGMSVIGPAGEEIVSATEKTEGNEQEIHLDQLGQCPNETHYEIAVFKLDKNNQPVEFTVDYTWGKNISEEKADALTSATQGAVLASQLNSPLLYTSSTYLPKETKQTLQKLGVDNIHLIDLNDHVKKDVINQLQSISTIETRYSKHKQIYQKIMDLSNKNDIIITTVDPWTTWLTNERKPSKETKAGLFIGPTAYIAAHHGSPVLIIDNHPKLSSAVVWHTEFWKRHGGGFPDPPSGPMSLTGRQAYDYFDEIGLDKPKMETMITVAGQYDIGAPWDRTFVGRAKPGKFFGSPVDTAYWICRNIFYPGLIFNNPATDPQGNDYIQGSKSERRTLYPFGSIGLKVTKPSKEETFNYPVLHSYITYNHRLNERFEKYYGFTYECRDDIIPGFSASPYAIDEGVVPGKTGAVWPDFSATISTPFYFEKGGYDNVYSTSYTPIVDNLNRGTLVWNCGTHGAGANCGFLITWPENGLDSVGVNLPVNLLGYEKESNPWRGYDFLMGSTENPDSMTMNAHGILAGFIGNPNMNGLFPLGWDYTVNEKPYRQNLFKLISYIPLIGNVIDNRPWLMDSSYFKDGVVGAKLASFPLPYHQLNGLNMDDDLENLHSTGWILSACLPAYKYLHLTMMRHGSVYQVIDPWPTSWYAYWTSTMPRDIVIGDTVGEAYTKGISHVGKLYATDPPEWWWDTFQNVVYFGDPDLRMLVPSREYSEKNYWTPEDASPLLYDEDLDLDGHMPYGATTYPHSQKEEAFNLYYILGIAAIILLIIAAFQITRTTKKKK